MPSPGQLVALMSDLLGVPAVNIRQHDQNLLSAGHRSKGGRGRSAAKVTARDATNLLIPVAIGSLVRSTAETWKTYSSLKQLPGLVEHPVPWSDIALPRLHALPARHTFADALTALIESAQDGSLQRLQAGRPGSRTFVTHGFMDSEFLHDSFEVSVTLLGPRPLARIIVVDGETDKRELYAPPGWPQIPPERGGPDLKTERTFSLTTILGIGEFLRGEGE